MKKIIKFNLLILILVTICACANKQTNSTFPVAITINEPINLVEAGLHMYVKGTFSSEIKIPSDATLRIELLNTNGEVVRYVSQSTKNSKNMWLYYPNLKYYDEEIDPKRKELMEFGWPEIMVEDVDNPEASFRNSTIKCWYSDNEYKAMFVYASDEEHGLAFNDTIGFLDENGKEYDALKEGKYIVRITLKDANGMILGKQEKEFEIGHYSNKIAVRFSPTAHMKLVMEWANKLGYKDLGSAIPGYIQPMNNHGHPYDMGIIPLNRSGNLAFYTTGKIHWFNYNITSTCSSYLIEHGVVQAMGDINDPNRFEVHHYDIGEYSINNESGINEKGKIVSFGKNNILDICRIDIVDENAQENTYFLDARNVVDVKHISDEIIIDGNKFAIMGVFAPFQLAENEIIFNSTDNAYSFTNRMEKVLYYFIDEEGTTTKIERNVGLSRYSKKLLGESIFEFYNLFESNAFNKNSTYNVKIFGIDTNGVVYESDELLKIKFA